MIEQTKLSPQEVSSFGLSNISTSVLNKDQLGLNRDIDGNWWSSYYVGTTKINGLPLTVTPKVPNIDFMSMFSLALTYQPSAGYFSESYGIDWTEEIITDSQTYNILTSLLAYQYLAVLQKLINKGLKHDYTSLEENLNSKIKGKIIPTLQMRINNNKCRDDRFYCKYQIFSEDIPVNRLLKKALSVSLMLIGDIRAISSHQRSINDFSIKLKMFNVFKNVSENVDINSIKQHKNNKLNNYYPRAIQLAKEILRHQSNSITNNNSETKKVPLFWIDMSRLFEIYVLFQLKTRYNDKIKFQESGSYYTRCDYICITDNMILDAKYKTWYQDDIKDHFSDMVADVREISGYARDEKLLSLFNKSNNDLPKCIIIYPGKDINDFSTFDGNNLQKYKIKSYMDCYRIGICVPILRMHKK